MLPRRARLTSSQDFAAVMRGGRRAGRSLVVAHLRSASADRADQADRSAAPARVGFVTSKAVGSAVTRNLVRRRLRHLMAQRLTTLPAGALLVLRATPAAAGASSAALADDLDRALSRLGVAP